jgi:DNA-directed RNA polymerase subunit RPC12/RpoP
MFDVEVHLRIRCQECGYQVKRRFLDLLGSRKTRCPGCNTKMVHLARGQNMGRNNVELEELRKFIETVETSWSHLVNEHMTHESRRLWSAEEAGPA